MQVSVFHRIRTAWRLLMGLRRQDLRAARTFVQMRYPDRFWLARWGLFLRWVLHQMWVAIPEALDHDCFAPQVSRTPMWLIDDNPWANHPWREDPHAALPAEVDTVVIGAGFTGAALAYHWAQKAPPGRMMVVVEMNDPASGASGRNEGLVVMGRYYAMVHGTVLQHLQRARPDLSERQQDALARQFAAAYCKAAYHNADLIEETIRRENFDVDYAREGWIQARPAEAQEALEESVRLAEETGFRDWTAISPAEVFAKSGMYVQHNAGFSQAAASFHPAKWVWSLLKVALAQPQVKLFTRTPVQRVEDAEETYTVQTTRGPIRARHVVNATESYTPRLHSQFHNIILPMQTQAACGENGPERMKPHIGISGEWFFCGRHGTRVLIGGDASRIPDRDAGQNKPSRFLTQFHIGEMKRCFGPSQFRVTNEWSGTVGYSPDEFPLVGLMDGKRQYLIAGMAGSGSGVSFNAARCIVNRILSSPDEEDDYPPEYFAPSRHLDPKNHPWPKVR